VADDSSIFKHLATTWQFTPIANAANGRAQTKVELQLEYEFASVLHGMAASAVWDRVSSKMVGAFEDRVKAVHGP
jgi:ribosome-associated toxin RatA of RatAB toxin-antitoxin module